MSVGFLNHAVFAFHRNSGCERPSDINKRKAIKSNFLEKTGDLMIWSITGGLIKLVRFWKDPRALTVALTALASVTNTFAFYPQESIQASRQALEFVAKNLPFHRVKLASYLFTMLIITGTGVRMLGRVTNTELLSHFYASHGYCLDENNDLVLIEQQVRV